MADDVGGAVFVILGVEVNDGQEGEVPAPASSLTRRRVA